MKYRIDQMRYVTDGPVPDSLGGTGQRIGSAWTKKPGEEPLEVDVTAGVVKFSVAGKLKVVPLANVRDMTAVPED